MKNIIIIGLLLIGCYATGLCQVRYSGKIESGYLIFGSRLITVDPGPDWKGYYLAGKPSGIDINLVNGIKYEEKLFAGVGAGYVNFSGINGLSVFADFAYIPLKSKLSPLLNTKIGYSHIWNQYENGTGTALVEAGAGLRYGLSKRIGVYIQSGISATQQSAFVPIRAGIDF